VDYAKFSLAVIAFSGAMYIISRSLASTEPTAKSDATYIMHVSDAETLAVGDAGQELKYNAESHQIDPKSFIGDPVVKNHDDNAVGGVILDSWAYPGGGLYQKIRVFDDEMISLIDRGARPSIKTKPLEMKGNIITRYEGQHVGILDLDKEPGCETCGDHVKISGDG